ncbi:MAG: hypothetical protein KF680_06225 [Cryobacterium sp.]|nr:hypothetical protein [Cryobacterium sp.]
MGIDGVGSSVIIAFAALLWFIYLVPTWLRRREYLSTERNAVRLQQTLRIMAETAQVPDAVRIETQARAIAAQQRALRARRAALGETGPVAPVTEFEGVESGASRTATESRVARGVVHAGSAASSSASRRLRRSRGVTALVLFAAVTGLGFGVAEAVTTGAWVLLAASVVVALGAIALLNQMAAVARMRREGSAVRRTPARTVLYDDAEHDEVEADRGWMPQPIPKPLYLQAREQAEAAASIAQAAPVPAADHSNRAAPHDELLAAAAAATQALRAAHAEVTRVSAPARPVRAEEPNRFARMGVIDETDAAPANLDEILARRRAVG